MSRHALNRTKWDVDYDGLTIKLVDADTEKDGNEMSVELENFGCRLSWIKGIKSFAERDRENHNVICTSDDYIIVIVKSCDGAIHPVTRCCDRTMFTQLMSSLSKDSIKQNKRNLTKPRDLISTMSSNGRDNIENIE